MRGRQPGSGCAGETCRGLLSLLSLLAPTQDDLRPISCQGHNSQGGIALTLIDSLDTLVVSGKRRGMN